MRVACESSGLNEDFGIKVSGSVRDVNFTATLGVISASVDWRKQSGNGAQLTQAQIDGSGILKLAAAVSTAAGVWYNLTKDVKCFGIGESGKVNGTADAAAPPKSHLRPRVPPRASSQSFTSALRAKFERNAAAASPSVSASASAASFLRDGGGSACPTCPPCDDCPPCPVSYCDWEDTAPCDYVGNLSKTFSWEGIGCNEALSQVDIHGVGRGAFKCVCVCVCVSLHAQVSRVHLSSHLPSFLPSFPTTTTTWTDIYYPPGVPTRNYTVASFVGPRHITAGGCAVQYDARGLRGAPLVTDRWSGWMTAYYGGRNVSHHRNIVWSNGALDPWSGQGVYPPGGPAVSGPDGPMVQNISADGSQIALILDLGAHHLDLMFSDPANPPCFAEARKIEVRMMREWCQEAYDAHP